MKRYLTVLFSLVFFLPVYTWARGQLVNNNIQGTSAVNFAAEGYTCNTVNYIQANWLGASEIENISISPKQSKLYAANRASKNPNSQGDFVSINASCAPVKFTITVNPAPATGPNINSTAATGAISACAGTASVSPNIQQVMISGANLTGAISLTSPNNFEISLSTTTGFGGALSINPVGGTANNVAVYVRSAATAATGFISGNITGTSPGARTIEIPVTGMVNAAPTANPVPNQTVINGTATTAINFSGTGNIFDWTNDTPGIGLAASGGGNIPSFVPVNNGSNPVTANISVIPLSVAYAYVANAISNNVSVIKVSNHSVVTTIPVGKYPCAVAVSRDGTKVYIANQRSNNLSVISASTNSVSGTISSGSNSPIAVAVSPDGRRLYVVNLNSNSVSVYDAAAYTLIASIDVGGYPDGVAVTPDGSKVYVTNSSNTISVIDATTNTVKTTITEGKSPYGIAVSPDGSNVYAAISGADEVSVISAATDMIIGAIPVGASPAGVAITPDGSKLYVANQFSNDISVISTAKNAVIATIPVGSAPTGLSVTSDGSEVYVANQTSNNVSVINTASNNVAATVNVGSYPISLGNFISPGTGCNGIPMNFTITVDPVLPASVNAMGALNSLSTTYGTPSTAESFNVSGSGLNAGISVAPPPGFELSADNVNFSATVTIGSGGNIPAQTVYIRLAAATPVGSYSGNIQISSTDAANFELPMPVSKVAPAMLAITADDKTKMAGMPNPLLTATYVGFVNLETPADLTTPAILATTATINSPVGRYPITVSAASSPNYLISFVPGTLTIQPPGQTLVIPNTFTPNGDGVNDTWNIKFLDFYANCEVYIFTRWGQKVYSSIGYGVPWDGTYKGSPLPPGTYYYVINLQNGLNPLSGFVAIIR
jgi:gliding motility-associated-like protein